MKIFRDSGKLRKWSRQNRLKNRVVALVPTMGFLHEGHISLIEQAKKRGADDVVVSIFVNPVQFGPGEDYAVYPRDEKADLAKCRAAGVSAVFLPTKESMYFSDHSVFVNEESLSQGLCGAKRPGHFRGVCTVVAKLFNIVEPSFAVFGRKDYQQAAIIKRMVRDLDFDIEIVLSPIVREKAGLALSSRNTYLSAEEKERALVISRTLQSVKKGEIKTISAIVKKLESSSLKVDYVECVDSETLKPSRSIKPGCSVLVAVYNGKTRLIDNVQIEAKSCNSKQCAKQ